MKWYSNMSSGETLEKIFYKALKSVQAPQIIKQNLPKLQLNPSKKIYIFGVGKASYAMAKEAEKILDEKIAGGMVVSLEKKRLKKIKTCQSTHPKVSKKSVKCAKALIKEIEKLSDDDYFLFFLSGGASAMVELPDEGVSFEEFSKITDAVLTSGVGIKAFNRVRKSISAIKGGKLAQHFRAKGDVFVLSDVIGDDLATIGSGPLYPHFPHHIIGNNTIALEAAKKYAEGFVEKAKILTTTLGLSSEDAADYIAEEIKKYDKKYDSFCLLLGGETTVAVQGEGYGGRNSELALRLLQKGCVNQELSILCAGSDGQDGNSNANGAFVDQKLLKNLKKQKIDPKIYIKDSNSFTFFDKLDASFITGLTQTNVMDFVIVLKQQTQKG